MMKIPIQSKITGGFWQALLSINSQSAIYFQWQQLVKSGCIENFRICAGKSNKPRTGLFFSDSDAYKWLDAACRILRQNPQPDLRALVDDFVELIQAAQADDGYLYTYNQVLFPGNRWKNLQIEHELYCMGHLIEAGISHHQFAGQSDFFSSILELAELIYREFHNSDWKMVDGHEEIEIALLKLAEETGQGKYRNMAEKFLYRRKAGRGYGFLFLKQAINSLQRLNQVARLRNKASPGGLANGEFILPARNQHKTPWSIWPRLILSLLSGKFAQRDAAFNSGDAPAGHAVRFVYLQTAAGMLARQKGETSLIRGMEKKWERMVSRRMYVTGGIGSLPLIEGFGRDFELDPSVAYNETCASLGSLFWNRELVLLTGNPRYDDLLEWQLYNASAVGFGRNGCEYFYNNPLISGGQVHRADWYDVPCCPSNISRTWASLGDYLYSADESRLTIHQYVTSEAMLDLGSPVNICVDSGFPWQGEVRIRFELKKKVDLELNLRYPSWAETCELRINGNLEEIAETSNRNNSFTAACGVEQKGRRFLAIKESFADGDEVKLQFDMPIKILHQDPRIHSCRGVAALSRGPVVYCLEDCDNPGITLPPRVLQNSLEVKGDNSDFQGIPQIMGKTNEGQAVRFIPYFLWGNRGKSKMSVFFYPI